VADTAYLDRLELLVNRLERLGVNPPGVNPAAVNADGSPGHVAPGELIESAWGNSVADTFQNWTWQTIVNGANHGHGANLFQARVLQLTTDANGDAAVSFNAAFFGQPGGPIICNAEPSFDHIHTLRSITPAGFVVHVRNYAGVVAANSPTVIAYIAFGQF
jgi:hypothetical protein